MRKGSWLGVDVGTVRVGVAACDPDHILAYPLETVQRGPHAVADVARLAEDNFATTIIVGLPKGLNGGEGSSAEDARGFAAALAELVSVPVRLLDERFSTSRAQANLHQAGMNVKKGRRVIDQAAATVILENALDIEQKGNLESVTTRVSAKEKNE